MDSINTPVSVRRQLDTDTDNQADLANSLVHLMREVNLQSRERISQRQGREAKDRQRKPELDMMVTGAKMLQTEMISGEKKLIRPASSDNVGSGMGKGRSQESKRLSAFADIIEYRGQDVVGSGQSVTRESSQTRSYANVDSSQSKSRSSSQCKSRSSSQKRHSSRNTSRFSKTSSGLDTTGSSRALNSSLDSSREETSNNHIQSEIHPCNYMQEHIITSRADGDQSSLDNRSSYFFGEAPDLKEILADMNGRDNVIQSEPNHHVGDISPHAGEVVRIRVPFNHTEKVPGQFLSTENIQRLVDQQISPSYNGHKVTIQVNRSSETLTSPVDKITQKVTRHKVSTRQRKVSSSGEFHSSGASDQATHRPRTGSVQNLPRELSRNRANNNDSGGLRDFRRETFF